MTPRGRLVAEVFDCRGAEFPSDYLESSGHLDPSVAVRLHHTCAALYDGRLSVGEAYDAWDEWESVLKGFVEGDGRDSLYELMALADPLTPEEGEPTKPLAPLDREALSQAMDWLKVYIVSYSGDGLPSSGRARVDQDLQHFTDRPFSAHGSWQRQVGLDLVTIATAVLVL